MGQLQRVIEQQIPSSPALDHEAEIKRIRDGGPLLLTDRDISLHRWLDNQRQSGNSGYILSAQGSGISDSCQYYRMQHVKRRGTIIQLPVLVVYIQLHSNCSPSNLYMVLLQALNHQITTGKLRDKRPRTYGQLRKFGTQLLIVDDAEFLTYEAFCELVQVYSILKIPTILSGNYCLHQILQKGNRERVGNSFLDFHNYPPMTRDEMVDVIESWEKEFLKWPAESELLNQSTAEELFKKTGGLKVPLFEILKKAAILALEKGTYKITKEIVMSVLNNRNIPRIFQSEEKE
ncbi:hypothetical protein C7293_05550 [filamentous cyanobacterium CCT1]|nr:hypothetical protein C7293_05550 [filamentous cyanobacterium CCT1]PSN81038.1 hypothetical protein C8B47_03470 [filamentous cyanobacterium CCP4]